ncbi:hypothetical protein NEMBOFW57_004207 [Staphylotrichum longicolle]|uniref:Uncharacterized protein n=1 Tax=Staphylotrichum longicolle TaxID=669026 RepID=A0AAD4I082_9PEZI|nr:hypothetical protein NEMBOFW57_004207 [Staphylotrichum longicolle]
MDFRTSLLACLCGPNDENRNIDHHSQNHSLITEKPPLSLLPSAEPHSSGSPTDDELSHLATQILTTLLTSPAPSPETDLTPLVAAQVSTADWTSYLAERLLHALEDTLKKAEHVDWGEAVTDAYNRAVELAEEELRALWEYVKEHPYEVAAEVLLTVLALGVLARLVPAFVRVLGFGRLGPVEADGDDFQLRVRQMGGYTGSTGTLRSEKLQPQLLSTCHGKNPVCHQYHDS